MTLHVNFYTDNHDGGLYYTVEDAQGRATKPIPYNKPVIIEDNLEVLWGVRINTETDKFELVHPAEVLPRLSINVDEQISLLDVAHMLERSYSGLPLLVYNTQGSTDGYLVFGDNGGVGAVVVNTLAGMHRLKTPMTAFNKADILTDARLCATTSEDIDMSALDIDMYVHVVDGDYHRIDSRFTVGRSVLRTLPCVSADHTHIAVDSQCLEVATSDTRAPCTLTSYGRMYSKVSAVKVLLDMVYAQAGYV